MIPFAGIVENGHAGGVAFCAAAKNGVSEFEIEIELAPWVNEQLRWNLASGALQASQNVRTGVQLFRQAYATTFKTSRALSSIPVPPTHLLSNVP